MTDDGCPSDNRTFLGELDEQARKGWKCASCGKGSHRVPIWTDGHPYCYRCALKKAKGHAVDPSKTPNENI